MRNAMIRRLPPLNALRAFEAGVRHLSFTLAAQELHVTPSAVSHQVKLLERYLEVTLFRRLTRRVVLTKEGEVLLPLIADAFDRIAKSSDSLKTSQARARTLSVSVTPSFGGQWLAQRLGRFWAQHPDIDLRLDHSNQLVDFSQDDVDMAVRWGRGTWPDVESEYLMRSSLCPVCSPSLLSGSHPVHSPEDLRHHTLLNEYNYEAWKQWLLAADLPDIDVRRGPVFDNPNVLEQAIISGQGIALIRLSAANKSLASGQMIRPFKIDLETGFAYYMIYPPGARSRAKVAIFRHFLLEEVATEQTCNREAT